MFTGKVNRVNEHLLPDMPLKCIRPGKFFKVKLNENHFHQKQFPGFVRCPDSGVHQLHDPG
jgi:hypothetical protein